MSSNITPIAYQVGPHYCIDKHYSITLLSIVQGEDGAYKWHVTPYVHGRGSKSDYMSLGRKMLASQGLVRLDGISRYDYVTNDHIAKLTKKGAEIPIKLQKKRKNK